MKIEKPVKRKYKENLLTLQDLSFGIQKVTLNIKELYPNQKERIQFERRLFQFLDSHSTISRIFRRKGELLIYKTECIIPKRKNLRLPLLLLFGNPALHSIYSGMFFSFEGDKREHRFWRALKEADVLSFKSSFYYPSRKSLKNGNQSRKKALYDLHYYSPFRVGLATFYSMPTEASSSQWAGVAGLHRLFRRRALRRIAECEKERVEELIQEFVSPGGVVIAFQKDAYLEIKSSTSPDYELVKAKSGKLVGTCECDPNVRLFCFPPTRLLQGRRSIALLRAFKKSILKSHYVTFIRNP